MEAEQDQALRRRAQRVIPNGMWGHMDASRIPVAYPQYFARAPGCRLWDGDGRKYIDFLRAFGPMLLGYGDPDIERAAKRQRREGDIFDGPSSRLVELAEAVTGSKRFRAMTARVFMTRSFWYAAVAMAAALATLDKLGGIGGIAIMERMGRRLRDGIVAQAAARGIRLRQSGPPQMPVMLFEDDYDRRKSRTFCADALKRGTHLHRQSYDVPERCSYRGRH